MMPLAKCFHHIAAYEGNNDIINVVFADKSSVNLLHIHDSNDNMALHLAAKNGHIGIVHKLI